MKSTALIFVIFAGALKAEVPAGATDLVPRSDSPAAESLKMKDEPEKAKVTIEYGEFKPSPNTSSSISKEPKSDQKEKSKWKPRSRTRRYRQWPQLSRVVLRTPRASCGHVWSKAFGKMKPPSKEIAAGISIGCIVVAAMSLMFRYTQAHFDTPFHIIYLSLTTIIAIGIWKQKTWAGILAFIFPAFSGYWIISVVNQDTQLWLATSWSTRLSVIQKLLHEQFTTSIVLIPALIIYLIPRTGMKTTEPNQAPQTTICTVTDCAPSSTLRASADRVWPKAFGKENLALQHAGSKYQFSISFDSSSSRGRHSYRLHV
jgi:hypothetical protein